MNWEFAICQVMIAIGLVQARASPRIYRHLEKQLRVWVHGDAFVPLGYIVNVRWFFVKLQEFWVVTNRGILGPPGYHDCVQSIRVLGRMVERTADGITWGQILDMQSSSGNRSACLADQLRHLESETISPTLKERFRSTKKRKIGIVRTPCVHSIFPVTDFIYRNSA